MDALEQAEAYARKLSTGKQGGEFQFLTVADRGMMIVLLQRVEHLERRVAELEAQRKGQRRDWA